MIEMQFFLGNEDFRSSGGRRYPGEQGGSSSYHYLGRFGTSFAGGLFQIFMMLAPNLSGDFSGKWRDSPAFGSNSPDLEHHLFKRRDGSFGREVSRSNLRD
ncbi:MAG: hypothetical protein DMG97_12205 [Acidobacteria bacterium]|nr:MAG: hypothetical protein DMG97_12205 [Acidobacteriota bacterium]